MQETSKDKKSSRQHAQFPPEWISLKMLVRVLLLLLACVIPSCAKGRTPLPADQTQALNRVEIRYESEGLQITGLMSKPAGAGPFPLVLVNHGGFDPAERVSPFLDAFAKAGFVALASDYRGCGGSNGARELAKGEVQDVLNALKYARTLNYVDGDRVAAWGFSHGAILSLFAASYEPAIKVVVALQGPVEMGDAWGYWVRNGNKPGVKPLLGLASLLGGKPDEKPAAWRERSVLYRADKIKCPVLLIYSDDDKDDAVPTEQGKRMEAALKDSGNTAVELHLIQDSNHGLDAKTWPIVLPKMIEFVKRHL